LHQIVNVLISAFCLQSEWISV